MKNRSTFLFTFTMSRVFCFMILLAFTFSCTGIKRLADACNETPSTTHLVTVRNLDFVSIGANFISDPVNHNVDICIDHFPANTLAGHQYNAAVDEINRILGSELHFTTTRTGIVHKDGFELFPSSPTSSIFDYVDVNAPMPNNCSLPNDLTFAMRTCRFDVSAAGGTDHFTIMAKSTNYGHFSDASSDDYPMKHGILHEVAHAFGMNHTGSWATNDKIYISTMQGNLEYLSALDVSYLRQKYPETTTDHRNYVASSLTRFNQTKGKFDEQNPSSFYIDADNNIIDCDTGSTPEFFVAWFNTGTIDGESELCGMNRIYLREKVAINPKIVDIKTWRIATMPFLSQDQWQGTANASLENTNGINFGSNWELVFEVNAYEVLDEVTREDNIITKDVNFYNGAASCGSR